MDADERLRLTIDRVSATLGELVEELQVTEDELRAALGFLGEVGQLGQLPLLADVLGVSVAVDDVTHGAHRRGTASSVEGPFHRRGVPMPTQICRDDEPGDVGFVSGRVTDATTGTPLPGVLLDVWQTGAGGKYEHVDPEQPDYNVRGRLYTDEEGTYELRTVVPPAYEVPEGPVNRLLVTVGRNRFRPAHFHVKLSCEGYEPRTTQLFFEGRRHLDDDTIGAVKPELTGRLEKHDDLEQLSRRGVYRPFFTYAYDFALIPTTSKEGAGDGS